MDIRIGQGYDIHRLEPGLRLMVGGVRLDSPCGCVAHSDGDVLLHAITDALLGALGRGDIGELFPDTDSRNKDRPSSEFVQEALWYMQKAGLAIGNLDATVIVEEPRLSPYKQAIRNQVATLCSCSPDRVNVKAKTNEHVDGVGLGEAIAAQAVVLLVAAP